MDIMEFEPPGNLTWAQIDSLMSVLHQAFVLLRSPGYGYFYGEKSFYDPAVLCRIRDRSVAFGEALHNLPLMMFTGRLDLGWLLRGMEDFARRGPLYGRDGPAREPHDDLLYLAQLVRETIVVVEPGSDVRA